MPRLLAMEGPKVTHKACGIRGSCLWQTLMFNANPLHLKLSRAEKNNQFANRCHVGLIIKWYIPYIFSCTVIIWYSILIYNTWCIININLQYLIHCWYQFTVSSTLLIYDIWYIVDTKLLYLIRCQIFNRYY